MQIKRRQIEILQADRVRIVGVEQAEGLYAEHISRDRRLQQPVLEHLVRVRARVRARVRVRVRVSGLGLWSGLGLASG